MNRTTFLAFVDELEKIAAASPQIQAMKKAVTGMKFNVKRMVHTAPSSFQPAIHSATPPKVKTSSAHLSARRANEMFGLPLRDPPVRGRRDYDRAPTSAQSADASQFPVAGMSTPNIASTSSAFSPQTGPGGV